MHDYKQHFNGWRARREKAGRCDIFDNPADAGLDTDLRVGNRVTFTNEYGVKFENLEVLGFCTPEFYGRCVYLNTDSYWFPCKLEELKPYKK